MAKPIPNAEVAKRTFYYASRRTNGQHAQGINAPKYYGRKALKRRLKYLRIMSPARGWSGTLVPNRGTWQNNSAASAHSRWIFPINTSCVRCGSFNNWMMLVGFTARHIHLLYPYFISCWIHRSIFNEIQPQISTSLGLHPYTNGIYVWTRQICFTFTAILAPPSMYSIKYLEIQSNGFNTDPSWRSAYHNRIQALGLWTNNFLFRLFCTIWEHKRIKIIYCYGFTISELQIKFCGK